MDSLRITLKTERLLLRPWCRADLSAMADWPPFTAPLDQVWNWPQRLSLLGSLDTFFAIHDADPQRRAWTILYSGAVIGLLQLKDIHPSEGDAIMGIAFGHPWVGKGYGREALTAFLEAYFERFNFTTLRLEVALVNRRAYHLYETLMFQETRRFWRDAGTAEENRFLDEPAYAGLCSCFRWANGGVYQLYAEMKLSADRWRTAG